MANYFFREHFTMSQFVSDIDNHSLSAILMRLISSLTLDTQRQVNTVRIGKESNLVKKVLALIYTYLHNFPDNAHQERI